MTTAERMTIVTAHLAHYENEGDLIKQELLRIAAIRHNVGQQSVVLAFGGGTMTLAYSCDANTIVLSDPACGRVPLIQGDRHGPSISPLAEMRRASEVVYPAMRACLLMWLNEWECRVKRAHAEWESRDPVAEAVALSVAP